MCNILNSISFVNLYTELATVIRLAVVVVFFFKSGIQMCTTAIITIMITVIETTIKIFVKLMIINKIMLFDK